MRNHKSTFHVAAFVLGAATVAAIAAAPRDRDGSSMTLAVDGRAPDRSGPLGGYSEVVDEVAPSVVSVYASRKVHNTNLQTEMPELFKDPRLAPFFRGPGMPWGDSWQMPQVPQRGMGSGVILSEDGYILTNNHVVEGADEIRIALSEGEREFDAEIVGRDPKTDIAVLKVDADDLPAATIGDSSQLRAGDLVLAIGSPFGLTTTVTHGIVSAVGRDNLNITGYEDFIQTDASINPGNSGGALVDNRGRVVGINTAIFSRSGGNVGIGFAIPVNLARDIADRLVSDGEIRRGYLGVMLGELTPELSSALGVKDEGVLVNEVFADTPAEEAGFKNGDVIVAYNGEEVAELSELRFKVGSDRPGDRRSVEIVREGKERTLEVELGELPDAPPAPGMRGGLGSGVESDSFLEGVTVRDLDESVRLRMRLPDSLESGIVVTEVEADSAAAKAGIEAGNVIIEIDRQSVSNVRDASKLVRGHKGEFILLRVLDERGVRFVAVEK